MPEEDTEKAIQAAMALDTDRTSFAVRLSAVLVFVLLTVSFIITVNNMFTISTKASEVKDGAYGNSLAAGHIETSLYSLDMLVDDMMGFSRIVPRTDFDRLETGRGTLTDRYKEIDYAITASLESMNPTDANMEELTHVLSSNYTLLQADMNNAFTMLSSEDSTYEDLSDYISQSIRPVLDDMMDANNKVLLETTTHVDDLYISIRDAATQTIILTCLLMAAIIVVALLYIRFMNRKEKKEKALRDHLEAAIQMAQSASHAKSDFLSNMSHDIRTPMNAIMGLTSIANDNLDDPIRVKQCLTRISTSSNHLLSLINDVLDMNKIESGKSIINEERFSLPQLINEIITIIQPQAQEKHLKVEFVISNVVHEDLISDVMRLRQVLLNLLSNAIKYTNEGDSIRVIVIEDDQTSPDVANVRFVVEDTGIGMEESFIKYIFEPFERERNDFTDFTEGTGLGMAITKRLVEIMHGEISVTSELGIGSTFVVSVPFRIADAAAVYDNELTAEQHVLLVDDNYLVLQNTHPILESFDMVVETAMGGENAIEAVRKAISVGNPFDLVFIDKDMPDMDGIKTAMEIKEALQRTSTEKPVFILETYGWTESEETLAKAGIDLVMLKPLFRSRLHDAIRDALTHNTEEQAPILVDANKGKLSGRVLLVDDSDINMEIGIELISRLGPEVEGASDGLQAIAKVSGAKDGYYDLIYMDCRMPHMDGYEAAESIIRFCKERGRKPIPIVALTANAFDSDREHALASGMEGFIAKPINVKDLEDSLRKYLPAADTD